MSRPVSRAAAVILLAASLVACSTKHGHGTPAASTVSAGSRAASSGGGDGKADITVGAFTKTFTVTCTRSATTTQASGNAGSDELALTVVGSPVAVLVSHGSDGSTTIYQAIPGLRDDSGKASASVTVTPNGDSYQGRATFVLTRIDNKGNRSRSAAGSTSSGTFDLECRNGYASPPSGSRAPSVPSVSAAPSASKSS